MTKKQWETIETDLKNFEVYCDNLVEIATENAKKEIKIKPTEKEKPLTKKTKK